MSYSIKDFRRDFPDEDACLDFIFTQRYGHESECPSCLRESRFYRVRGRKCYACMYCGHQVHPLAQTIFHKSSTPLLDWFYAMYLFSVSKNGVAATELARQLGVTYKTAYRMGKLIRGRMWQDGQIGGMGTVVEADETFYGPKSKGLRGKTAVLGAIERDGQVRTMVTDTASTYYARTFLTRVLRHNSELHTDESRIYKWAIKNGLTHETVNHSLGVYSSRGVTTNTIEGFWGQLKRSLSGTYHRVSQTHLALYVDEFVFRYNHERPFGVLVRRSAMA